MAATPSRDLSLALEAELDRTSHLLKTIIDTSPFATMAFDESQHFLTAGLGFTQSDWLEMPIGEGIELVVRFYHCNARHHSIALARAPFELPESRGGAAWEHELVHAVDESGGVKAYAAAISICFEYLPAHAALTHFTRCRYAF